jgi:hypothetical protein
VFDVEPGKPMDYPPGTLRKPHEAFGFNRKLIGLIVKALDESCGFRARLQSLSSNHLKYAS